MTSEHAESVNYVCEICDAKFWKMLSYYPITGLSTMKTSHLVKSVAKALKTTQ